MQLHEMPSQPKVFIGMDINKKSWSVSIQTDLFFHKSFTMPPDASELASYIEPVLAAAYVSQVFSNGIVHSSI